MSYSPGAVTHPRVLIVAENVSATFGGEAFLPLHYFRVLRARGVEAWLLTHERVRTELEGLLRTERDRIFYVPDTAAQVALWKVGSRLPARLNDVTLGSASHLVSQWMQRHIARRLVREHGIDVVHEPIPVSPKLPSAMFDVGAPVVIGPMNGGMAFPPAFRRMQGEVERRMIAALRGTSDVANIVIAGKRKAAALLVANERTRQALPSVLRGVPTYEIVENGVDLSRFRMREARLPDRERTRFAFVGRLVDWKGVDILLDALAAVRTRARVELDVFGDGPERVRWTEQASRLGLGERVRFHGFLPQERTARHVSELDGLVLPSLYECGGAVVLEAMAIGLPVIATKWGGPADYLDDTCGVLIEPRSREHMVSALAAAMARLADDPALRDQMGARGRAKVEREYDWERKVDRVLDIYRRAAEQPGWHVKR
jgi:glycosyltransferase involved in cell wall biosynthesis